MHYGEFNVTGSSGGGPHDLAAAVDLMVNGRIDPGPAHRPCRDLDHTIAFLAMIRDRANDGKAVVYPQLRLPAILAVDQWGADDERGLTRPG